MDTTLTSGFGADATTADVLAGIDLTGKLAIVTGGYSGLGLQTTRALTDAGAHVVVPARRRAQAEDALAGIDRVEVDELDLADLSSVRAFAQRFTESGRRIDLLLCNAGIMACPETRVGPGWEAQFATNHLGHFALVNHLRPAIGPGARIVSTSSRGHFISGMRWDDVHFVHDYNKWQAYGQAKTANILFTVHLDTLARAHGIRAFAVHPGMILTNLVRHLDKRDMTGQSSTNKSTDFKTVEQGAATQVWAATAPGLANIGGVYCEDCNVATLSPADGSPIGVRDYAIDPEQAARLWALSAELTGIDALS